MINFEEGAPTPEEYNQLRASVGWGEYCANEIAEPLAISVYVLTVRQGDKAIGMGRIVGDGKMVHYIQDVIVLKEYQGSGIGKKIMEMILEFIIKNSIENTIVGLMSASGKEGFYKKFGFEERPNNKMGAGMTIFIKK